MSYTAPLGNVVEFTLDAGLITPPPAGDAIGFELVASSLALTLTGEVSYGGAGYFALRNDFAGAGEVAFQGSASIRSGAQLQVADALVFSGAMHAINLVSLHGAGDLGFAGHAPIFVELFLEHLSKLRFSGSASFFVAQQLAVNATIAFGGELVANAVTSGVMDVAARLGLFGDAVFGRGNTWEGRGAVGFTGAVTLREGRAFTTVPSGLRLSGAASLAHGRSMPSLGGLALGGRAEMTTFAPEWLTCEGALTLKGSAAFHRARDAADTPTLWVCSLPNSIVTQSRRQELFCHV